MEFELTIQPQPGYLHAVVTGRNSLENVVRYMEGIRSECKARGCFRVLIEERLEGPRLATPEVFQIVSEGSAKARGVFEAIAYVDANAEKGLMQFAETVAVNRGLPIAVFPTVAEAEKWLREQG